MTDQENYPVNFDDDYIEDEENDLLKNSDTIIREFEQDGWLDFEEIGEADDFSDFADDISDTDVED